MMHSHLNILSSNSSITASTKITLLLTIIGLTLGLTFSFSVIFSYMYLDCYLLSPAQATFLDLFIQLPWIFRPVWIAFSNYFKPFGYQKKSFLIMTTLIGFLSFIVFIRFPINLPIGGLMLFLIGFSLCFLNCLTEEIISKGLSSVRISEYERQKEISKNSTIFFVTKYLGKIIGAVLMTLHLQKSNKESFFIGTSICLILAGLISLKFPEKRIIANSSRKSSSTVQLVDKITMEAPETGLYTIPGDQPMNKNTVLNNSNSQSFSYESVKQSIDYIKKPTILLCVTVILLSGVNVQSQQTKFYFYTQKLDLAPDFMGFLKLIECISILLAMCVYYGFFTKINIKTVYKGTLILSSFLLLTELIIILGINQNLGLSNKFFAFLLTLSQGLAIELKSFPIVLLAKGICPKAIEPLLLSILVSIGDMGSLVSSLLGGIFTSVLGIQTDNFNNLWILAILGAMVSLSPLLVMKKLDVEKAFGEAEAYENSWTPSGIINEPTSMTELDNSIVEGKAHEIFEL